MQQPRSAASQISKPGASATGCSGALAATLNGRVTTIVSVLIYLAFCTIVVFNALAKPIANWDMLAYVASALQRGGELDPSRLHSAAYGIVRAAVTGQQWHELTTLTQYRIIQAQDADAFASMLPMYQVKGGYVVLINALSGFASPVTVMRVISLASTLALMTALLWSFWRLGQIRLIGIMTPILALLNIADLASIATPDPPVTFLVASALCLMLVADRTRPPLSALCMLVVSVLLRPDMLVATVGLPFALVAGVAASAMLDRTPWTTALRQGFTEVGAWPWAAAVAGMGAYLVAKAGSAHPGWYAHFVFSLHEQRDTMAGFSPAFDLRTYLSALARAMMRLLRDEIWPWLMLALLVCGLCIARLRDFGPVLLGLTLFMLGVLATRVLVFPLLDARVAAPQVLTAVIIAIALFQRTADNKLATDRA